MPPDDRTISKRRRLAVGMRATLMRYVHGLTGRHATSDERVLDVLEDAVSLAVGEGYSADQIRRRVEHTLTGRRLERLVGEPITDGGDRDCEAVVWHGPGHQSRTRCHVEGKHEWHEVIYGADRRVATFRGQEATTGVFDEPPEED